ncbi:Lrp/AsnC family transcriptional regulator [Nocardia carnea]|uniref:Lrp/AsnC family transcriptional regulator n=1 Tax=Nocardia carnea TaxID=37328 RepID=UPI0024537FF1|nr:Lrp/AsnC family transcriptional regulator [Nocardia carnea]
MISVHPVLDEKELRLLHGLQVAPRISWAEAARILGTTAAGEAARWAELRERGLAWITAHPGGSYRRVTLALVEVDCLPGARRAVVDAACADPRAVTVEESTRGRDILLTVITEDLAALARYVLDDLETLPGVARQRTFVATAVHRHGSHWRLDALSRAEESAFQAAARAPARGGGGARRGGGGGGGGGGAGGAPPGAGRGGGGGGGAPPPPPQRKW